MADRNVFIRVPAAHLAKGEVLAAAYPMGAGTFQRAMAPNSTPAITDVNLGTHWCGMGNVNEDMAAAFEASALMWEIKEQLDMDEHPLIAPYEVISLDGTDWQTVLAGMDCYLIEPE